jgi:hypothetical protein
VMRLTALQLGVRSVRFHLGDDRSVEQLQRLNAWSAPVAQVGGPDFLNLELLVPSRVPLHDHARRRIGELIGGDVDLPRSVNQPRMTCPRPGSAITTFGGHIPARRQPAVFKIRRKEQ